ncbi:MAG: hypothetical protein CL722_00830 [Chloroflexi bacterium]|nr:hypothetical protein [Chloroflexota bacterium]
MTDSKSGIYITSLKLGSDSSEPLEQFYHWDDHEETDSVYSLQRYVERHGNRLRDKYLSWVHDLGESRIAERRLIDHLVFEDGLSYWWMTLIVEKSDYKSPIRDIIYLIAIREIISDQKPTKIRLVNSNLSVSEALSGLCMNLNITYEWEQLSDSLPPRLDFRYIFHALPHSVQALIGLARHMWCRWPFRKAKKTSWFGGDKSLFLCSYFSHVDTNLANKGKFHSYYWEGLHEVMRKLGISGNWLQHYFPHDAVPSPQKALNWVQSFNKKRRDQGFHTFLDTYLSWRIVMRVLKRWFRLMRISRDLSEIKHVFSLHGSGLSLWPLMREDWYNSMCGRVAIDNLLYIELFDVALSDLPHQKMGLYLCENQSWERALIHAWRKHRHGQLIAVWHGMTRFWDLRFFAGSRTVKSSKLYPMPQADLIALNGKMAIDTYLSAGYPKKSVVECEALRYCYLDKVRAGTRKQKKTKKIKVLIFGDYLPSCTIKTLQLLEAALPHMTVSATYTIKPHPAFHINPDDYPSLNLEIVTDHLEKILYNFDIAYSANRTSAAVDAYIVGLKVVVMLDNTELNFSPLRGQSDARFVNTPEGLAEALQTAGQNKIDRSEKSDFLFLDPELQRWKKLLSQSNPT